MKFILWRHAEAEIGTGNDLIRPLTPKGHRQAKRAAQTIATWLPKHPTLCVSEATRSQQTAAYLPHPTVLLPPLHPESHAAALLPILQHYQDHECVIWVGHQPWIGDLAGFLLTGTWVNQGIWFKKGACWHMDITWLDQSHTVKLRDVVSH